MAGDDMSSNGNGNSDDVNARVGILSQRTANLETGFLEMRKEFSSQISTVNASIGALANELRGNSRVQWPVIWSAIGVCFAVMMGIGGALYLPVRESINEAKADIRSTSASALSVAAFQDFRAQYENNRVVSRTENIDKFGQVNTALGKLNDQMVPRAELERVWQLYDQRFADQQRQIEQQQQVLSGQYGQRDLYRDVLERLDRMERLKTPYPTP